MMVIHDKQAKDISYETDRSKFLGRMNTVATPAALTGKEPLSDSQGSVLDPIASIRCQVVLEPEGIGRDRLRCRHYARAGRKPPPD